MDAGRSPPMRRAGAADPETGDRSAVGRKTGCFGIASPRRIQSRRGVLLARRFVEQLSLAVLCLALLSVALLSGGCSGEAPSPLVQEPPVTRLTEALGGGDVEGYRRAIEPREFSFPRDHGPHAGFRNEWWYVTGNLDAPDGGRYGFHVTFFRVALAPAFAGDAAFRDSPWASRHLWMAHAAITDVQGRRHVSEERFAREGAGLAGATVPADRVWLEDWVLSDLGAPTWRLDFAVGSYTLELALTPQRAPVLQGDAGLSQKGREPGNASYYYSLPRIAVQGELRTRADDAVQALRGQAWLDREWSSGALDPDQVGWDWFALQLDDGTDLMYYQLRQQDGSPDPLSKGRWMPAGEPGRLLLPEDVDLVPTRFARAGSGTRYPVAWRLTLPALDRELLIEAVLDDQEMTSFIRYWEGAVDIRDATGRPIGRGFVELTGYDD